jgi:hypothetical protein
MIHRSITQQIRHNAEKYQQEKYKFREIKSAQRRLKYMQHQINQQGLIIRIGN